MREFPTILVATPDRSTGQGVMQRLTDQGYRAIAVERGGDALLAVVEENIRLVILDLSIQEPSGAKTGEIIRKTRPRLPVIVLSGDHSVEAGRQILQHGVFYYLIKPVDPEELDQLVGIALAATKRLARGVDAGRSRPGLPDQGGAAP